MFLKNISNSQDISRLKQTYNAQIKSPVRGDLTKEIKDIMQELKIEKTIEY